MNGAALAYPLAAAGPWVVTCPTCNRTNHVYKLGDITCTNECHFKAIPITNEQQAAEREKSIRLHSLRVQERDRRDAENRVLKQHRAAERARRKDSNPSTVIAKSEGDLSTPKRSTCELERNIWNTLRVLERTIDQHIEPSQKKETKSCTRWLWVLEGEGAKASWNIEGHKVRPRPSLDWYDGN